MLERFKLAEVKAVAACDLPDLQGDVLRQAFGGLAVGAAKVRSYLLKRPL